MTWLVRKLGNRRLRRSNSFVRRWGLLARLQAAGDGNAPFEAAIGNLEADDIGAASRGRDGPDTGENQCRALDFGAHRLLPIFQLPVTPRAGLMLFGLIP